MLAKLVRPASTTCATPSALFCIGFSWDRVSQTIALDWFQIAILLISASWVARITGLNHRHPAYIYFLKEWISQVIKGIWWVSKIGKGVGLGGVRGWEETKRDAGLPPQWGCLENVDEPVTGSLRKSDNWPPKFQNQLETSCLTV
jgi:hypothetical protein